MDFNFKNIKMANGDYYKIDVIVDDDERILNLFRISPNKDCLNFSLTRTLGV